MTRRAAVTSKVWDGRGRQWEGEKGRLGKEGEKGEKEGRRVRERPMGSRCSPETQSTTTRAPSVTRRAAVTSEEKST